MDMPRKCQRLVLNTSRHQLRLWRNCLLKRFEISHAIIFLNVTWCSSFMSLWSYNVHSVGKAGAFCVREPRFNSPNPVVSLCCVDYWWRQWLLTCVKPCPVRLGSVKCPKSHRGALEPTGSKYSAIMQCNWGQFCDCAFVNTACN